MQRGAEEHHKSPYSSSSAYQTLEARRTYVGVNPRSKRVEVVHNDAVAVTHDRPMLMTKKYASIPGRDLDRYGSPFKTSKAPRKEPFINEGKRIPESRNAASPLRSYHPRPSRAYETLSPECASSITRDRGAPLEREDRPSPLSRAPGSGLMNYDRIPAGGANRFEVEALSRQAQPTKKWFQVSNGSPKTHSNFYYNYLNKRSIDNNPSRNLQNYTLINKENPKTASFLNTSDDFNTADQRLMTLTPDISMDLNNTLVVPSNQNYKSSKNAAPLRPRVNNYVSNQSGQYNT